MVGPRFTTRPARHVLDKLSVVVPCFNEEAVVKLFHLRLTSALHAANISSYEILYVDDGSRDATARILASMARDDGHIRVIRLSRNFGHQNALLAGLSNVSGNPVITIDSDLQDPPEIIPKLVNEWNRGSKVVSAQRNTRDGETWFKVRTAALYYRLLNALSPIPITADCGDYRLMDIEVVTELCNAAEADPYIRGLVGWLGFKETIVKYDRHRRAAGSTKYSLLRMVALARQGVLSTSSLAPKVPLSLTVVALLGLTGSTLLRSDTKIHFWGGILANSLLLTIMGQYLESISRNSGNKPPYIIDEILSRTSVSSSMNLGPEHSHEHEGISA